LCSALLAEKRPNWPRPVFLIRNSNTSTTHDQAFISLMTSDTPFLL
jgi:hypothetical protein